MDLSEITANDKTVIHKAVRPWLTRDSFSNVPKEEAKKFAAFYDDYEEEQNRTLPRERRMEIAANLMSLLNAEERSIIEHRVETEEPHIIDRQYAYYIGLSMTAEFDIPERQVMFLILLLRGAKWYAGTCAVSKDVLSGKFDKI